MSFNKMISIRRKEKDIYNLRNAKIKVTQMQKESAFEIQFIGPKETPYEKGKWKINLELPNEYPYKSPSVGFINKIYHPNIDYASGSVCLDVINQTWTPMYELVNVFEIFLPQLLTYPNPESPLNHEAGQLYKHNKSQFNRKVIQCIEKYALNQQYIIVPIVEAKMEEDRDDDDEEKCESDEENDESFQESNSCSLSERDSIADHEDLKLY